MKMKIKQKTTKCEHTYAKYPGFVIDDCGLRIWRTYNTDTMTTQERYKDVSGSYPHMIPRVHHDGTRFDILRRDGYDYNIGKENINWDPVAVQIPYTILAIIEVDKTGVKNITTISEYGQIIKQ